MSSSPQRESKARVVSVAFGAIAAVLALSAALAILISRSAQHNVDEISSNALTSVRLLSRIGLDIELERRLVEAHIFESTAPERSLVERRIAALEADFETTARQYEPLASFPGERQSWQRLHDDVDRLREPTRKALLLSSANRDDEARALMHSLAPAFDAIEHQVDAAVDLNARQADAAQRAVRRLLSSSLTYGLALSLLGIAVTIAVGLWVTYLLTRAERRERAAFAVLEERNRELDAFAGRVAHDLRAPLTVLNSAASLSEARLPEGSREIAMIRRGVSRMNAMVEDLLLLSRIAGASRSEVCDPAPGAADIQQEMAERVAHAGGSMQIGVAAARVRCSDGLFRQIVSNLAENALKYRRSDVAPEIAVAGRVVGGEYELRVSDNGVGMTTEEASRAFDPLFRARRLREVPGTGIGLSIVKRIVEAYGGSTAIESRLGQGTTVVVRLPLADGPDAGRAP